MAGRDTNIGAKRARETRAALGLPEDAAAPCVLTAVERDLELAVVVAALHEGVAGCCWRDGERVVLWVNGTQAVVRQRFTLAHELGHVRCGHAGAVAVDTYETLAGMTTDSREVQANAFAAELLAPAAGVRAAVAGREPSLDDVVRIAARYGISAIAAVYRLDTLGLSRRAGVLKREVEEGLVEAVWARLAPAVVDDALAALSLGDLPRLSPALAGGALAAVVGGRAAVGDAAVAAEVAPQALAHGVGAMGLAP